MKAKRSFYDRFNKKAQRLAGTISAIIVIGGALFGVGAWLNDQVTNAIAAQIGDLKTTMQESDKQQNQAITRLELMNLIQTDSNNVVAIEKMAKYYFQELDGDLYMTQKVSDWCASQHRDCSVLIGGK